MTFFSIFWAAYIPVVALVLAAIGQRSLAARRVGARTPSRRTNADLKRM